MKRSIFTLTIASLLSGPSCTQDIASRAQTREAVTTVSVVEGEEWPSGVVIPELGRELLWLVLVDDGVAVEVRGVSESVPRVDRRITLPHEAQWLSYAARDEGSPLLLVAGASRATVLDLGVDPPSVVHTAVLGNWPSMLLSDKRSRMFLRDGENVHIVELQNTKVPSIVVPVGAHSSGCLVGGDLYVNRERSIWRVDGVTHKLNNVRGAADARVLALGCEGAFLHAVVVSRDGNRYAETRTPGVGEEVTATYRLPEGLSWRPSESRAGVVLWSPGTNSAFVFEEDRFREVRWAARQASPRLVVRVGESQLVAIEDGGYIRISF